MSVTNDNLVKDLNQIKRDIEEKVLASIDRLKEQHEGETLADIERIERDAWQTVLDIDEISKKINSELKAEVERNTILFRTRPANSNRKREKIGEVWI